MHIQRTVLLLESPSSSSRHVSHREEAAKLKGSKVGEDAAVLALARKVRLGDRAEKRRSDGASGGGPRKEKAKGPNPLSCMKKKKKGSASEASGVGGRTPNLEDEAEKIHKKTRRRTKTKDKAGEDAAGA